MHSPGGLGTLPLALSLLIADLGCETQHPVGPDTDIPGSIKGPTPGPLLCCGRGQCMGTLSYRWTTTPEKNPYIKAPCPLSVLFPFFPTCGIFPGGRRRSHSHLTCSSTFCRKITMGSDTVVRNNIERSQIPLFYLAPIIVSYKSLV